MYDAIYKKCSEQTDQERQKTGDYFLGDWWGDTEKREVTANEFTEWKKIFENHTSDKLFISKIRTVGLPWCSSG